MQDVYLSLFPLEHQARVKMFATLRSNWMVILHLKLKTPSNEIKSNQLFKFGNVRSSMILRRSRSLAVAHSLPFPSDGLHLISCS